MKRLWIITKMQLLNLFFQNNSGKKRKIPSVLISGLIMFALSLYYSFLFSSVMETQANVLPALVSLLGTAIVFFSGVSTSQGMLFGFKDYDMLMAMPVTEKEIVTSKITVYTIMQYLYTVLLVIPAMIIHGYRSGADALYFVRAILGFLAFPLIPMVLSVVVGLGMQALTAGKRYGKLLQNGLTVAMIALVYFVSFNSGMNSADPSAGIGVGKFVKYIPSADWYLRGVTENRVSLLLLMAAVGVALFIAFILIYSRSVLRLNARGNQGYHVKDFKLTKTAGSTSLGALFRQERQRYFANFTYFLNTSIGMIMLAGFSFYVIFINNPLKEALIEVMQDYPDRTAFVWQSVLLAIHIVGQMTCTTGSSISLEGKSLWILKSIPASVKEIFTAKIMINLLLILVPSLLSLIGFGIALRFPPLYYLCGFAMVIAGALFISMLGLLFNLRFPKLEYDREAVVIKQSLSAFLSMMVPMFLGIGMMVLYFVTEMQWFYAILAFYVVCDIILYVLLVKYGEERFRKLA